ncbi:putative nuclease HARBI1 [Ixodes scapularis]|uniref:putative nuclease HARBI1 n=1 Tax=Ixodes scapularis TaxID=6945 RepID=UPI001C38DD1E|nr:putative nuclease HARBI1 [Ixodes scapularis]
MQSVHAVPVAQAFQSAPAEYSVGHVPVGYTAGPDPVAYALGKLHSPTVFVRARVPKRGSIMGNPREFYNEEEAQSGQDFRLQVPRGRPAIDVTKQTLIFVWSLANLECFRSVGDRFGLSKSTVCRVVHRVGLAVLTQSPNFVSWPTEKKALHIISGFEAKAGFPGVLGAIDGSHIVCKGLQGKDAQSYINRHRLPSVLLQAICDHEAKFLHCSAGDPGSVHDARMYRRSELPTILTADKFPFDSHLLGDGAYPLRQSLLVPYRNNGRLTEQHRNYNTKHATTRVAIERAFGILKGRFRRLKYIEARRPERIVTTIVAACVMHNACMEWRDIYDGPLHTEDDGPAGDGTDSDSSESGGSSSDEDDAPTASRDKARGKAKRDFIMHSL